MQLVQMRKLFGRKVSAGVAAVGLALQSFCRVGEGLCMTSRSRSSDVMHVTERGGGGYGDRGVGVGMGVGVGG